MKTNIILIALSALLVIPNFISWDINGKSKYNHIERFDSRLSDIKSIADLERFVDDSAASQHINIYSEKYTALLAYVISCRFYHGFSHFQLNENWIAAVGEKCLGYGLASKVEPEDIMQADNAACSQQAIVMMAVLRQKNISYRKVGFPHHYALEARIRNNWYYFDPNMEPDISLSERLHENWKGDNDNLKKYYSAKHGNVSWQLGDGAKAQFGTANEVPAQNADMFQHCTAFLSKILWCFPLFFAFARRRRPVMYAVKPINHSPRNQNLTPIFSA